MQVWSQRKRVVEDAVPVSAADDGERSLTEVWALRVLGGVHAGAERKLSDRMLLMIGSSDDCDIIFTDAGVAAHHCIISRDGADTSIRSVDAQVRVDDQFVYPGDPRALAPFSLVRVGGACFALGPHWSERWQALLEQMQPIAKADDAADGEPRSRHNRVLSLAVAAALVIASAGALFLAQRNAHAPVPVVHPVAQDVEARQIIEGLGYSGIRVKTGGAGVPQLNGYVEKRQDLDRLRRSLNEKHIEAVVDVRDGAQIAADVAESIRMANMHATTKWEGGGHVLIEGHFGDGADIETFLASRTMKDFNANLNLIADVGNLDPKTAPAVDIPEGKRIMKIVDGDDPYLVTADDSLIYKGGKMPTGETFDGIDNDDVLVREGSGDIKRLPRSSVIDASFQ